MQDLYQYVVSKEVVPPFSLYTPHPRWLLKLSQDSIIPYDDTLIVAPKDNSYDTEVLIELLDTNVSMQYTWSYFLRI